MILVTGAAGKTGRTLLTALKMAQQPTRAFVRTEVQAQELQPLADEVMVGDLSHADALLKATASIQRVYHICPNMHPDEVAIAQDVMAAALANGISHFVYHSVLHPQTEEMPHHWQKLRVEELLFKSRLNYTILQPAAYMQNVLVGWNLIVEQGLYRVPYALETKLGMVDLQDVTTVGAHILTDPIDLHNGAIYELATSEVLDQRAVAQILGQVLGREVQAERVDRTAWRANVQAAGLNPYAIDTLEKMFDYYENYGFWGNERVLTDLLGRPPARFADWIGDYIT